MELGLAKPTKRICFLKEISCMADNPYSLVVYPDGRLYKCEHVDEKDCIGNLSSTDYDRKNINTFRQTMEREECEECPLYPSCYLLRKCFYQRNTYSCNNDLELVKMDMVHNFEVRQKALDI